jgi:hypothetical protein
MPFSNHAWLFTAISICAIVTAFFFTLKENGESQSKVEASDVLLLGVSIITLQGKAQIVTELNGYSSVNIYFC